MTDTKNLIERLRDGDDLSSRMEAADALEAQQWKPIDENTPFFCVVTDGIHWGLARQFCGEHNIKNFYTWRGHFERFDEFKHDRVNIIEATHWCERPLPPVPGE